MTPEARREPVGASWFSAPAAPSLDDGYPVGRPLRLRFELATLGRIGCRAIVRRHLEGSGVGVEFLDIDPADRTLIAAFVRKHEAQLR